MRARAEDGADLEAFEVVLDRLPPHCRIRVAEAAEFIGQRLRRLILKGVGIHRIEEQPARLGGRAQIDEVGGLVPGDVQRDAGVERVSLNTTSQSSSFSKMLRGSPAIGNRANRVPPDPSPHDGTATVNAIARSTSVSASTPRRASCRARWS